MTIGNKDFTLRQTLLITGMLLIVLYGTILLVYQYIAFGQIKHEFQDRITSEMGARFNSIQRNITKQHQRIQFLFTTPPIQGIARATSNNGIDPIDGTNLERWKIRLANIFEGYLENYPDINQVRYIGITDNGKELVRVDRQGTNIKIIPAERLQAKGNTDYFKEVSKYHPRKIYVSNINLNREYGQIQLPYSPTQRIAMPVFGLDNKIFGIVIINIDARYQIELFINSLNEDLKLYILNNKYEFVHHPEKEKSFLFEFDHEINWQNEFSEPFINRKKTRLIQTNNLITSDHFYYLSKKILISGLKEGRFLTLIIGTNEATMDALLYKRLGTLAQIMGGLLFIVFLLFSAYQVNLYRRIGLIRGQAEFKAIVSGSHEGIIAMDKNGYVNSWNNAASNITGYTEQMALGQSVFELFLREGKTTFTKAAIDEVYNNSDAITFECEAENRKGNKLTLTVNLSPIILDNNNTIGVAALFSDITEQKKIEQDIINLNTSLEEKVKSRTKELEEARNQALEASTIKSEFIANVSHEIRTPMNGVLGMLDLLAKDTLTKRQKHQLEMAKYSAQNLTSLVNDILDISKIEAGKLDIDESGFNLIKFLSDVSTSLAIRAQEKDLYFILDASKVDHEHVLGDAMRINQIVTNLVGNALKFTDKGGITVKAETQEQSDSSISLKCSVIDTGKGIASDKLATLFESFTQENSSITKQYGGTGLGLTISRQLCQLMGGSITVSSTVDEGSIFSFNVKIKKSVDKPDDIINKKFPNANILLASKNIKLLDILSTQLKNYGCTTQTTHDQASLEALLTISHSFNLILIDDIILNDVTSVLQNYELTSSHSRSAIYIIENSKDSLIERHAFKSLMKPVTPVSLIHCLESQFNSDNNKETVKNSSHDNATNLLKGYSILVVDDNNINLEVAKGVLEDFDVSITLANSAEACFDEISKHDFDFVLMDCQMPVMDGYTATRKIRNGESGDKNKDLIIIAMTAHAMTGAKDTCIAAGMNDYIPKPINPDYIKTTLLKWSSSILKDKKI